MAIFKALTFDGVNSLDYGIYITGEAVYNAPERAVEMVNIPGKNGALALDQGRFENIEVTYHAGCFADSQADFADKVMKFRNALASRYTYKRLTDEYHPDEYRLGLYKSGLEVDAVRYGTAGEFNIVFECKPQRFLIDGDRAISPTEWSDVQTESGELVTIESDGSLAVKSLEVSLSPIQDLNGYDKPWSGGAGKNKLPSRDVGTASLNGLAVTYKSDGSVTVNGTATASTDIPIYSSGNVSEGLQGSFIMNGSTGGSSSTYRLVARIRNTSASTNRYVASPNGDQSIETASNEVLNNVYITVNNGTTLSNKTFYPMLRLASETDATYEPYSNICPISGHDSVDTWRSGRNLLDTSYGFDSRTTNGVTFTVNADKSITVNGTATATAFFNLTFNGTFETSKPMPQLAGKTATAKCKNALINPRVNIEYFKADGTNGGRIISLTDDNAVTRTIPSDFYSSRAYIVVTAGATVNNVTLYPQIELGTEVAEYEPYNGNTYTTSLGRTVYGGTLDVVSGVLTVDRASITFVGTETWNSSNNGMRLGRQLPSGAKPNSGNNTLVGAICSAFSERTLNQTWTGGASGIGFSIDTASTPYIYFCRTGNKDMTQANWNEYLASNPITVVYPLATPQTYQLTPQQIDLLLGTNHLWSDGEITVEYGTHPYYNPTQFESKPLLVVTGKGTLGIGEYILTITGTASQTLYIDCETMEIYTIEGTVLTGASSLVSINKNDFPVLKPGINNISVGSGITAVTITPRWWRI